MHALCRLIASDESVRENESYSACAVSDQARLEGSRAKQCCTGLPLNCESVCSCASPKSRRIRRFVTTTNSRAASCTTTITVTSRRESDRAILRKHCRATRNDLLPGRLDSSGALLFAEPHTPKVLQSRYPAVAHTQNGLLLIDIWLKCRPVSHIRLPETNLTYGLQKKLRNLPCTARKWGLRSSCHGLGWNSFPFRRAVRPSRVRSIPPAFLTRFRCLCEI